MFGDSEFRKTDSDECRRRELRSANGIKTRKFEQRWWEMSSDKIFGRRP